MPLASDDKAPVTNGVGKETIAPICAGLAGKVNKFLGETDGGELLGRVRAQTRVALGVIERALGMYSLEEISLSYNGGKDCLVLLILLLTALHNHSVSSSPSTTSLSKPTSESTKESLPTTTSPFSEPKPLPLPPALQSVYIISPHPFPEVTTFVDHSVTSYKMDLARYNLPMKAAFEKYLEEKPKVKAILVGTRRTDPNGGSLTHFDRTDHGWPGFMRVHPVIDWHYAEIWGFIRHLEIPYCELYDRGYTSLGGTTDTHPNPALKANISNNKTDEKEKEQTFRPAYELIEDEAERLGRDW